MARLRRVVLDACVLYPNILRDTLLSIADAELFHFVWSDQILEEVRRNLVENGAAPAAKAERTIAIIASVFAEGRVSGHERHLAALRNDPKDRHVVAAALEGEATLIVTNNLKDFRLEAMPEGVVAVSPDDFLCELFDEDPGGVVEAIRTQAARLKNPPTEPDQIVQALGRIAPRFAREVLAVIHVRTDEEMKQLMAKAIEAVEAYEPSSEQVAAATDYLIALTHNDARAAAALREQFLNFAPILARAFAKTALKDPTGRPGIWCADFLRGMGLSAEQVPRLSDAQIRAMVEASTEHRQ